VRGLRFKHGDIILAAAIILQGSVRIVSTYRIFSQTIDEPGHIACGMELLQLHSYRLEPQHAPLARMATALLPFLTGSRLPEFRPELLRMEPMPDPYRFDWLPIFQFGNHILTAGNNYSTTLALARLGILPFYILACVIVCLWARRLYSRGIALICLLLYANLPPVLAHAGLATTDMAFAATMAAAFFAFFEWTHRPTRFRLILWAVLTAMAIATRVTALVFLPLCFLSCGAVRLLAERKRWDARWILRQGNSLALFILTVAFTIWACYLFRTDMFYTPGEFRAKSLMFQSQVQPPLLERLKFTILSTSTPWSVCARGFFDSVHHARAGHSAYLFGKARRMGWWYYYPVALGVKLPLVFLLLVVFGSCVLLFSASPDQWHRFQIILISAGLILIVFMSSSVDIGVRLILPIVALLALLAGVAVESLCKYGVIGKSVLVIMLSWFCIDSVMSHPNYLSYFNEFSRSSREPILVDTDLDWGQDLLRLTRRVKRLNVDHIGVVYSGSADFQLMGIKNLWRLDPGQVTTGYVAISKTAYYFSKGGLFAWPYFWIRRYQPIETVGSSIYLFHIPPTPGSGP